MGPEDFIVNKLARPDRGAVDEQDVKSVLVRQANTLDNKYLTKKSTTNRSINNTPNHTSHIGS